VLGWRISVFLFAHEAFAQAVDQSTIALKGCESFGVIQP